MKIFYFFRSIFWKIFGAFWFANVLVIGGTALMVFNALESRRLNDLHQDFLSEVMQDFLVHFEEGRQTQARQVLRRSFRRLNPDQKIVWRRRFQVFDEAGREVFNYRVPPPEQRRSLKVLRFAVDSASGKRYWVDSFVAPPPRYLLESFRKINAMQLFFVLVASAFVSGLLTLSFVRPLKALSTVSRRLSELPDDTEVDKKLLQRKDEFGDLARDVAAMAAKIRDAIVRQKQLLHDVSHEVRAPLARLQTVAGLIEQEVGEGKNIQRLHVECERVTVLLQQILDFSRADHPGERVQLEFPRAIDEVIDAVSLEYSNQNFCWTTESLPRGQLLAEKTAFESALHNVLANACKYDSSGGPIELAWSQNDREFALKVSDHGPGVNPDDLEKISQPFYRAGNVMHTEGFGLGLSIAQRAMQRNGGVLEFSRRENGGLSVTFSWPRASWITGDTIF